MHRLLLTAAAAATALTFSSPAAAQSFTSSSGGSWGSRPFVGIPPDSNVGGVRIHRGHDRHGRGFAEAGYFVPGYNDYGDYDANRSFDPEKWNDWWHDRPDRAFPRWMSRNQDCARRWYSGDVLTC
jgi:hypothetical protein